MDGLVTQLSAGGILIILIVKEAFNFVANRNGSSPQKQQEQMLDRIERKTDKLWSLHDVRDHHGTPVWYTGELAETTKQLAENIKKQTESIQLLREAINEFNKRNG